MMENDRRRAGLPELHDGLSGSFWRRMLALWGLAPVPFFTPFEREAGEPKQRHAAPGDGEGPG